MIAIVETVERKRELAGNGDEFIVAVMVVLKPDFRAKKSR